MELLVDAVLEGQRIGAEDLLVQDPSQGLIRHAFALIAVL